MRYVISLAFKGTHYHGWQKQHNAISVQGLLDEKLSLIVGENIETLGCGRTDAGVHAKQFFAHFDTTHPLQLEQNLAFKLNRILPADIVVFDVIQVSNEFNVRFDAVSRTYQYIICTQQNPFLTEQAWFQYGLLDIEKMNAAAALLLGSKDFESFSKVHTQVNNFICEVFEAHWRREGDRLIFTIKANRFLRNMVRAIVGTLVNVGRAKISVDEVTNILSKRNRSEAGQSVPALGLFLTQIDYPKRAFQK
jgi:tRNA pseudouridine38-40 synthase